MFDDAMLPLTMVTSWIVLMAAIFPQGGISLKMVRVSVPQYTLKGEPVELLCEFDLQGDKLYSVSWYKDHDEFYRHVPKSTPSQHTYRVDGIKVDKQNSDAQRVVIRNVPLIASGSYRCEVSAEAPSFASVSGESRMNVVALPKDGPQIIGEERDYQIGDEINLNCTSAKSFPPARLRWYVNDELVGPDYEAVVQQHGLMTAIAGLRFQVGPEHFQLGRLQVRCVATISAAAAPTAPAPASAPVLQLHRAAASSPTPHLSLLDYNQEALFSVRGSSNVINASFLVITMTSLASLCS